jgi:hypothetical protein
MSTSADPNEQRSLLKDTPDAAAFVKDVIDNVGRFKLFDGETFTRVDSAILASAGVDSHGQTISLENLESFVSNGKDEIVWGGAEHNPLIQPIGRVLAMKVFTSPVSGIGFIAGVIGTYGEDYYLKFSDVGIDLSELVIPSVQVEDTSGALVGVAIAYSPQEIAPGLIAEMLSDAPDFVDRHPQIQFRKAVVSPPHLTLMIEAGVLLMTRKFLEKSGEKLADAAFELLSWLKKSVFKKISELTQENAFVQFSTFHNGCRIALIIASKDPEVLADAAASIGDAVGAAIAIVDKLRGYKVATLTFEYDLVRKKWLPLHAASRKGRVIAERPHLIVIKEAQGVSIGGFGDFKSG